MRYTPRFYRLLTAFSVALGLASLAFGLLAPVVNGRAIVSVLGVLLSVRLLAAGVMGVQESKRVPVVEGVRIVTASCDVCGADAWWTESSEGSYEDEVQSYHKTCPGRYVAN